MNSCTIHKIPVGGDAPVRLMGVINASPESFYPSSYVPPPHAFEVAMAMVDQGAEILDVGARATGPGSLPIDVEVERKRISETLRELSGSFTLSVDTMHPEVLEEALRYEIHAVNDISGLLNPQFAALVAEAGLPAILMAAEKRPGDVGSPSEVLRALRRVQERCDLAGVREYILDPGIGLWTSVRTVEDNWELCRRFRDFRVLGRPLLAAISRKSFLGELVKKPPQQRMAASLALNILLLCRGADLIRTHDVEETADAIRVFDRMERRR